MAVAAKALNVIADALLSSAAGVLATLVDREVTAVPASGRPTDSSIELGGSLVVTLGQVPSAGVSFIVRYAGAELNRIVGLILGEEVSAADPGGMGASLISEIVAQVSGAMADQLARELGVAPDGVAAALCEDASALPAPPFESFVAPLSVGGEFELEMTVDFDGVALAKMGLGAAPAPPNDATPATASGAAPRTAPVPQAVSYSTMAPTVRPAALGPANLDFVNDVPLEVSAVLGHTSLSLRDVVALAAGSVFELDKGSTEPVDLYVNNILIARGEVVVVDDKFAVKITELNPSSEKG